ncbi:Alpha/Beta hydrolase protein [Blyttiomyces helicus]|uniref:Alpha/Beta hydrolase protein n=1 Tax=Blyttiomyces helicus TaxID=388810 RepID=A0A4P9WA94_9FUNG|nr:Alpha/Beta hydrolase protein [Blyttiomyces helicus]|eukprot:RKO88068.1 Alpha/Beta hydrolase protein [Blyttiomyces helicus]
MVKWNQSGRGADRAVWIDHAASSPKLNHVCKSSNSAQSPEVQKALHISRERNQTSGGAGWGECSNQLLPGIVTFLYEGLVDFILHHKGIEAVIGNTTWHGATGFQHPHVTDLYDAPIPGSRIHNRTVAGRITSERGLTYVTAIDAGHEIPMYKPAAALSTIKHLLAAKHTYVPGTGVFFDLAKIGQP